MRMLWMPALTAFVLIYSLSFSQEVKKAQEGTYYIEENASKRKVVLAEEVLFAIEANRKEKENVIMSLPTGIEIIIFSKDSVKAINENAEK